MPPKTIFTHEAVVNAAYELVRREGLERLTARHVARELGASIAPVYSAFQSMESLEEAVVAHARHVLLSYTEQPITEIPFLNVGVGLCRFAREERVLFRTLFMSEQHSRPTMHWVLEQICERMGAMDFFAGWSTDERMALLRRMSTYTHGLASLICLGVIDDTSDAAIVETLGTMGAVVIPAAVAEHERA